MAEERDRNISRVQELEASITELKNAAGKRLTHAVLLSFAGFLVAWECLIRFFWH